MKKSYKLLLVDDDRDLADVLAVYLKTQGISVTISHTVTEAANLLKESSQRFQIILSDLRLPDGDGLALIEIAKRENPELLAAVMTGYASLETALKAIRLGAYDYITKPFNLSEIEVLIRNMCERISLEAETKEAREATREAQDKLHAIYNKVDALLDEKLELMRLKREMKKEFEVLSNKVEQVLQVLGILFPQANRSPQLPQAKLPIHRFLE